MTRWHQWMVIVVGVAAGSLVSRGGAADPPATRSPATATSPSRTVYVDSQVRPTGLGWFQRRRVVCSPATPSDCPAPSPVAPQPGATEAPRPLPPTTTPPTTSPAPVTPVPAITPAPTAPPPALPSLDLSSPSFAAAGPTSVAPGMLGDFIGVIYQGTLSVVPISEPPAPSPEPFTEQDSAVQRIIKRYKVADFTSPIPITRVLYSYNYFQDAFETVGDVHRNFFGLEYAFWDQNASIEVKTSINSFVSFPGFRDETLFGDLRTTAKVVGYRDDAFLVSGGLAVGWPIGPAPAGVPQIYLLSPFVGYLYSQPGSDWFLQGFFQVDLPLEVDDQPLLHTDIGVGYWLLRDPGAPWIRGIVPTAELHLYTPLGESPSGSLQGLVFNDVLNMTLGVNVFVGDSLRFATGLGLPLSTNKDYDYEGQFHCEWRF